MGREVVKMLHGKVPETDQMTINEMLSIFKRREASYDKLLIQIALSREDNTWKNILTKIDMF